MPITPGAGAVLKLKSRRGTSLVDVIVMLFLLTMAGLVFSATFPAAYSCSRQAEEYKTATAIAQLKMEQLRGMNYESLNQALLYQAGYIDASPTTSPYRFTDADNVSGQLALGYGEVKVEDISSDTKKLTVTVHWIARSTSGSREVKLTSYVTDRRTRKVTGS